MIDRNPPADLQALRSEFQRRAARITGEAERCDHPEIAEILRQIVNSYLRGAQQARWLQVQQGDLPPISNNIDGRRRRGRRPR